LENGSVGGFCATLSTAMLLSASRRSCSPPTWAKFNLRTDCYRWLIQ
jgi:hypothetical protein